MNLINGCYYENAEGKPVRCQIHADEFFHIFGIDGLEIEKIPTKTLHKSAGEDNTDIILDTHVNGWKQIGKTVFDAAKAKAREANRLKKSKKKKKRAKSGEGTDSGPDSA